MKFIDQASIHVKAGDGGHGCIAFLREKFRPKGGPCGGDGGRGGSIILRGDTNLNTLLDISLNKHYKAKNGEHGKGKNMHGKNAPDVIINVPLGTVIKDSNTKHVILDIVTPKSDYVLAKGGNGGFGNARYKTDKETAPRIANDGLPGEEFSIDLELKVLADVGLVGFPNAGKSTFISVVSNARPKIADYPFTTLTPNLGIVQYDDYKSFVVADIPGLIEDASKGKGLGNKFLKHIERTRILAYMLDPSVGDIAEQYYKLVNEITVHHQDSKDKKSIILITKNDIFNEDIDLSKLPDNINKLLISSVSGFNIRDAVKKIASLLD